MTRGSPPSASHLSFCFSTSLVTEHVEQLRAGARPREPAGVTHSSGIQRVAAGAAYGCESRGCRRALRTTAVSGEWPRARHTPARATGGGRRCARWRCPTSGHESPMVCSFRERLRAQRMATRAVGPGSCCAQRRCPANSHGSRRAGGLHERMWVHGCGCWRSWQTTAWVRRRSAQRRGLSSSRGFRRGGHGLTEERSQMGEEIRNETFSPTYQWH
jgi:hypothetical protein